MNKQTEALKELLEAVEHAIEIGDWKVDGRCDPDLAINRAKKALEQDEINLNCKSVQKRLATQWGYVEQPAQEPVAWISVKDRLPEFVDISEFEKSSSDVLILIDGKHIYIGSYIWDSYSQETEFCMRDLDGGYEGAGDMNVTHWMPLPEAPKE